MVKKCVAQNCSNSKHTGHSLHRFPQKPNLRRQWVKFVQTKRKNFNAPSPSSQAVLCGAHFEEDCFASPLMNALGLKTKRTLKEDSVPTIHATMKRPHTGESELFEKTVKRRVKVVQKREVSRLLGGLETGEASQNDMPCLEEPLASTSQSPQSPPSPPSQLPEVSATRTIGTQCSERRLHYRSKETMTTRDNLKDVGTQYECLVSFKESSSSTPVKTMPAPPQLQESPIKIYEDYNDPLYEPGDLSFQEDKFSSPDTSDEKITSITPVTPSWKSERKYIVFESKLLELFSVCPTCAGPAQGQIVREVGSLVQVVTKCPNCEATTRDWNSQPIVHQLPVGNLVASAAILLSGSLPTKALKVFKIMNVAMHNKSTYFRHQTNYVIPSVVCIWKEQQEDLFQKLRESGVPLDLAGDGRSDSPGHSAKYGGYTIIEQKLNKILDIQLVQSNEVGSSNACELEGLKRCVRQLAVQGLNLSSIVTDRHKQINAYIRDDLTQNTRIAANMKHYFDIWHVSKGLKKKLDALCRSKGFEDVALWKKAIINHMYFCAASVPEGEAELLLTKWKSVVNHIHNVHDHDNPLYPTCDHGPLVNEEDRDKEWLVPGTPKSVRLEEILEAPNLCRDIKRLSPRYQTSSLEAFHSLIIHFAPKHTHFSWLGQLTRYYLAALHYNENSERMQAVTENGQPRWSIRFPKYKKGGYTVRKEKTQPTYNYTDTILQRLQQEFSHSPAQLRDSIQEVHQNQPDTLSSDMDVPDKRQAVQQHVHRFADH